MKKQNIVRVLLLLGTLISLYFVPWPLLGAWIRPLPATIEEQMENAIGYGFDGIILYVDKKGTTPQLYAAGLNNREGQIPADPRALFKIASVGKLYDAVAVAKLVGQKKLDLDGTLASYLPELSGRIENADKITIRMLVQHRSGIPNVTDTPDFWINPPKNTQEAIGRILDLPADFGPGKKYAYSNTNYLLITTLIEKVTERPKFDFIKTEILEPLDLHNTFGSIHEVDIDRVMSGYYVGVEEDIKTADYGSMVASAADVGIFLRALNEGTLFEEGEADIYRSLYEYNHTGLIPGYQSIAKYHPELDAVVVQFTNTTDFDGYLWSLSEINYNRIIRILKKRKP